MIDISYQNLFDIVRPSLPEYWDKVVLYFALMPDTYETMYFVRLNNMEYLDCFHLEQDREELLLRLSALYKEVKDINNKECSVITVVIYADGEVHADFDYTRITDNYDSYFESWMKKYIS